jgi:putative flippase GtrA
MKLIITVWRRIPGVASLTSHIPAGQFARYLVVGLWNTLFGYVSFAALTAAFTPVIPYSYVAASVLSSLLSITIAFLGYKFFVFKTKGNYLREWTRCVVIYSGSILIGVILLPILVGVIRHTTAYYRAAPYIAGAVLTAFGVIYSFFGHKKYSFRSSS